MPRYRPYGEVIKKYRLDRTLSLIEMEQQSGIIKSQICKAEKGAPNCLMEAKSLKAFATFFGVEVEMLIHTEDPYWIGKKVPSNIAVHGDSIQNEGVYRKIPTTNQGLLKSSNVEENQSGWNNKLQPSKQLLAAFQATIDASASPMGLLGHNQRVWLCNNALTEFFSAERLDGLTLNELGRLIKTRLTGEYVDIDKLHETLREKAADGPCEILKLIGDVDFLSDPHGRWNALYQLRLLVWPVWEESVNVGSMFQYLLSEKESVHGK